MLMFNHFLNYLKLCTVFRLLNNSCYFIRKNTLFFKASSMVKDIEGIFMKTYGVIDLFNNDLDALKSRIKFVQAREDTLR